MRFASAWQGCQALSTSQFVLAVAALHERGGDLAHGALAPERLLLTSNARVVIVDYVLGSALERLQYSRERYWTDFRIALPGSRDRPASIILPTSPRSVLWRCRRFSVAGCGTTSTRRASASPRPRRARVSTRRVESLPPALRTWLDRALQHDPRGSFPSAIEARVALERVTEECRYDVSRSRLQSFLARYRDALYPSRDAGAREGSHAIAPTAASRRANAVMAIVVAMMASWPVFPRESRAGGIALLMRVERAVARVLLVGSVRSIYGVFRPWASR